MATVTMKAPAPAGLSNKARELMEAINTEAGKHNIWVRTQANSPAQKPWFSETSGEGSGQLASGRARPVGLELPPDMLAAQEEVELVSRLAARRTPIEDARKLIADYVVGTSEEKQQKAKTLFAALYSTLNAQRDQVMNGIERFSRKQKAMAEDIREKAQKMRETQDKPDADQASSEQLATQLSWQTRIFEDRRKSTAYVCDVPVLIEKRLFELGRAIQDVLNASSQAK